VTNSLSTTVDPIDMSVILLNWNALDLTSAALASLREHTSGISYEVFVVDNGTTEDPSVTELPRRFPWITFITNPTNLGFTKANNQAVRQSRGRYVLILNNDTVQTENALGEAVGYMDAHPDVGALGVLHRNIDAARSFQPSFYPFPTPLTDILGVLGFGRPMPAPQPVEQDVDWVCGSFLLIRRECLEQVGPLDERYFVYDEDIDWCLQARRAGWKVRYWPGVSMVHLGAAANPFMRDKTLVMFRSHITYLRKNHSAAAATAFYLAMAGKLTLAVAKTTLRALTGKASRADVEQRCHRLINFAFLRSSRVGV
jgi:GT2 family glycosyltransferase